MPQDAITPKALAASMGISPKALRRFMRSLADQATKAGADPRVARVGQGNRYDLTKADAAFIVKAWAKAHAKAPQTAAQIERKAGDAIVAPTTPEG